MFDNKENRFMTRSIAESIHPEIALLLWNLIDSKKKLNAPLDYLQVFELSESNGKQVIIQSQEVPEMRSFHILPLKQAVPITKTIWCIDNRETEMMLFPEDY
ncbi:DUF960 family protein [Psychrobacillus sp. FSL K6-2684]|uniref:DUF960 family protein n=1 Tax=unclassified Psychrobacillus TaxID=2636677 RepID=UPI0030F641CB